MADDNSNIHAYEIYPQTDTPIEPAPIERSWMEAENRFAYRCLPLTVANQSGWVIRNPKTFIARWNGGLRQSDLKLSFICEKSETTHSDTVVPLEIGGIITTLDLNEEPSKPRMYPEQLSATADPRISSHFGNGIITITIPYLFRTPPGVNL